MGDWGRKIGDLGVDGGVTTLKILNNVYLSMSYSRKHKLKKVSRLTKTLSRYHTSHNEKVRR